MFGVYDDDKLDTYEYKQYNHVLARFAILHTGQVTSANGAHMNTPLHANKYLVRTYFPPLPALHVPVRVWKQCNLKLLASSIVIPDDFSSGDSFTEIA